MSDETNNEPDWRKSGLFFLMGHELYRTFSLLQSRASHLRRLIEEGDLEKAKEAARSLHLSISVAPRTLDRFCKTAPTEDQVVDLNAELRDVLRDHEPILSLYGVEVRNTGTDVPFRVQVRASRTEFPRLAFTELLRNAIHWCAVENYREVDDRGREILVLNDPDRKPVIEIISKPDEGWISMTDSGPGVPPGHAEDIFKGWASFRTVRRAMDVDLPHGRGLGEIALDSWTMHPFIKGMPRLRKSGYGISLDPDSKNAQGNLNRFVWKIPDVYIEAEGR